MASMSVSAVDLSCPVCFEIFKHPVLLTCTHSICKGCLKRFWETKEARECPVCRAKSSEKHPPLNLHLKNLCERFSKEREDQKNVICTRHQSEFRLFCENDEQVVCLVCRDSKLHNKHNCNPIDEAANEHKEILKTALKPLQDKLERFKYVKLTYEETAQYIKFQLQKAEKQIKEEFEKLHQFLRDEEAARIAVLREEEEQKSEMMEKIEKMSRDISSLSDTIKAIEEEMKADDVTFLQNYKVTVKKAQCTLQDPQRLPQGAMTINVAKHLDNLKFRVWEKMQEIVQYSPETRKKKCFGIFDFFT
ncbi:E3 ubiquitin-protein ligase TRIM35-like [Engraulis encrasicolus]|uniref:E3 ubiquitin-protein ligase TRIM35-like n=1 Tax=Engraulis encrasicolus TaxID=184585 RepID=UPI002FD36A0A